MVRVSVVYRVVFALAYVGGEWLTVIRLTVFAFFALPFRYKIGNPRVRTCRIIWRVAKVQDIFVLAYREALYFTEFRVKQLFAELFSCFFMPL